MTNDYSEKSLNKLLIAEFGRNAKSLRNDCDFNVWLAYSYLKEQLGLNKIHFEQEEYLKRIKSITEVLGI